MNKTLLFTLLLFILPMTSLAKQAQALLYPTRIVLEHNERTATLGLKNSGDATGGYRIELVDMHMAESGAVEQVKEGDEEPFSARRMVRISPRSITLEAGQDQTIRILVRRPAKLEEGEYRTHIKVTLAENNLDNTPPEKKEQPTKNIAVTIKPRLSLIIPLIIRQGNTHYTMGITNAALHYRNGAHGEKIPYADITLTRRGNRSSMGTLNVEYIDPEGKKYLLKQLAGLPVYRPTERRTVSLPLDIPPDITINKGKLHVTYQAPEKEGGTLLAEGLFKL